MIVAFTGHRPDKLGGYGQSDVQVKVRAALRAVLEGLSPAGAVSGMALGVDQWAAEICCELGIPWCAAVPFEGQESRWPARSQEDYRRLLWKAAYKVTVSTGGYSAEKMQARNRWMVDRCGLLIAVWDGSPGGTDNCVEYARSSARKPVLLIDPKDLVLSLLPRRN